MTRRNRVFAAVAAAALSTGAAGLLAAPAGAATTGTATGASCDKTAWQASVQGYPKGFGAGSPQGVYLWHTSTGFHLRVTHAKKDTRNYSGVIHSSAAMRIQPVKLESGDTAKLSADHKTIVFVFNNHGYIDGVDFHTDCASTLRVSKLHVGNNNLGAKQVYLGSTRHHPKRVPFVVHRKPVKAS